ncbi:MAG TPA: MogA/MoaB family molybdenum cofactor biosynthesis protein [Gaiellales bacterium]|nr:MogA/MoaB family molybdenum cofactor biosynthesis protein [Gaiellales bacterium]
MRAAVLTVSDGVTAGTREDLSGDLLAERLSGAGFDLADRRAVPDEADAIEDALRDLAGSADLVLTTGGTGFAPRDVTPEATARVVERATPGLDEHMRTVSIAVSPHGMLSRGRSGIAGSALIVNFPGSPKACAELFDAVAPALDHGLRLLLDRPTAH